jgi:hypothetical protein
VHRGGGCRAEAHRLSNFEWTGDSRGVSTSIVEVND